VGRIQGTVEAATDAGACARLDATHDLILCWFRGGVRLIRILMGIERQRNLRKGRHMEGTQSRVPAKTRILHLFHKFALVFHRMKHK